MSKALETYDLAVGEFTAGMNLDRVESQLANARMGKATNDAVSLNIDGTRSLVTTEREYTLTTLTQTNEVLNIDPDSSTQKNNSQLSLDAKYTM